MTSSSFYCDGYRDGEKHAPFSPPDVDVYAMEYSQGYADAESEAYAQAHESTDRCVW